MALGVAKLYVNMMVCGVVINSLEITLILQPAYSVVKVGVARAHENTIIVAMKTGFNPLGHAADSFIASRNFDDDFIANT